MKNRFFIICFVIAVIISTATGRQHSDSYVIAAAFSPSNTEIQNENEFIKSTSDSTLAPVYSLNKLTLRPGQLIMRKKIHTNLYGFYSGILDTAGFNNSQQMFVFDLPRWAQLSDMLVYRLYRSSTDAIGTDEPVIYFDNERIYTRSISQLCFFRNGIWFYLTGTIKKPFGSLSITSTPSGAQVILNGSSMPVTTPCIINNLICGDYVVELRLSHYQFFQKSVTILQDSVTSASSELISDIDTVFITGDIPYSLFLLPQPPVDKPYIVDDSTFVHNLRIRLSAGKHRIRWIDDEQYAGIDTFISIPSGKVIYFDHIFKQKFGIVRILPSPPDAQICINQFGCTSGERIDELPAGTFHIDAFKQGFGSLHRNLHVHPDTVLTYVIDLQQVPDSDGDGYFDSCDICPKVYGLYNGCPNLQLKPVFKSILGDLYDYVHSDRFTFGISLIGIVSKSAINQDFRNFLSVFSSGKTGSINNYKGITALNNIQITYKGLFSTIELGQWSAGLRYQRDDTLFLDSNYCFFFDSSSGIEPVIYIPSTSFSFGFHYNYSRLNVAYSLGYQWEDIVVNQIHNRNTGLFEQAIFNNDWWYHQLSMDIDFKTGDIYIPSIYFRMKYPFGTYQQTRWAVFNTGFQLKITTRQKSK